MSFFAVLFALLIEQVKPLPKDNPIHHALVAWVGWTGRSFDAGKPRHAWVVWAVGVFAPTLVVALAWWWLNRWSALAGLVLMVALLYLSLGFRQFSHFFTDIREALTRGDKARARQLLADWRHLDGSELPRTDLLRNVIEHALLAAHRHVFGVFFWFVLLAALGLGPAGAVFYRMTEFASRYWGYRHRALDAPANEGLLTVAQHAFNRIDHVPARLTAFGFAIVGNFEEAVAGWRRDAALWRHANEGIILAAAAGAVGVQLGGTAVPGVTPDRSKTFASGVEADHASADGATPGQPPQLGHLQSVVGLVWRSVLLWLLLLALLSVAALVA